MKLYTLQLPRERLAAMPANERGLLLLFGAYRQRGTYDADCFLKVDWAQVGISDGYGPPLGTAQTIARRSKELLEAVWGPKPNRPLTGRF